MTNMTNTDWIQFWLAIGTGVLAIISTITIVITLVQNHKLNIENSRAKIIFYIDYIRSNDKFFLTIKNFGNSIGKINYIKVNPKLDYKKIPMYKQKHPVITDAKNFVLAPNQKISSWFNFRNYPDKVFNIEISYDTINKTYVEKYKIDMNFIDTVENLYHSPIDCNDEIQALVWIEHQLSEISERIDK